MTSAALIECTPDWKPHVLWMRYSNLPRLLYPDRDGDLK